MVNRLMREGKHLRIAVGVVCASVVLLATLVMSIPAKAVSITITPSSTSVVQGNSITIDASIDIAANERIPISGVYLRLFSDAARTIELAGAPYVSPRTMSFVSGTPSSGYGYGYGRGYDPNDGQWYDFFGGYGYGFGGGVTLVYRAIISTSASWAATTYYVSVDVDADTHTFINTSSFSVTAPPPTTTPPTTTPPTTTPPTTTPPTTTPPTTTPPTTTPPTTTPPTTTPPTTTPPTTTPPTTTPPTTTPLTTAPPTTAPPTTATTRPPTTTATALPITTTPTTTTTGNAIPVPMFGSFSANLSGSTDASGVTQKPVVVASSKGEVNLTIDTGTTVTNDQGQSVADITVSQKVASSAPDDSTVVGFSTIIGQEGMKLDKPAPLTLKIDMTKIPAGASASDLTLARFDSKTQKWVEVSSVVDLATGTITGQITDLGEYAIISKNPGGDNKWWIIGAVAGVLIIAGIVFAYTRRKKATTGNLG